MTSYIFHLWLHIYFITPGEEAKKLLRTLKSPRAPMAKKRQVMRMTFGDYRTKMAKEEKKNAAGGSCAWLDV